MFTLVNNDMSSLFDLFAAAVAKDESRPAEVESIFRQALAEAPTHGEFHVEDTVRIEIPYPLLINIIHYIIDSAEFYLDDATLVTQKIQLARIFGQREDTPGPEDLAEIVMASLEAMDTAAQLNTIRLTARETVTIPTELACQAE